jgi:hypothetical protein
MLYLKAALLSKLEWNIDVINGFTDTTRAAGDLKKIIV